MVVSAQARGSMRTKLAANHGRIISRVARLTSHRTARLGCISADRHARPLAAEYVWSSGSRAVPGAGSFRCCPFAVPRFSGCWLALGVGAFGFRAVRGPRRLFWAAAVLQRLRGCLGGCPRLSWAHAAREHTFLAGGDRHSLRRNAPAGAVPAGTASRSRPAPGALCRGVAGAGSRARPLCWFRPASAGWLRGRESALDGGAWSRVVAGGASPWSVVALCRSVLGGPARRLGRFGRSPEGAADLPRRRRTAFVVEPAAYDPAEEIRIADPALLYHCAEGVARPINEEMSDTSGRGGEFRGSVTLGQFLSVDRPPAILRGESNFMTVMRSAGGGRARKSAPSHRMELPAPVRSGQDSNREQGPLAIVLMAVHCRPA